MNLFSNYLHLMKIIITLNQLFLYWPLVNYCIYDSLRFYYKEEKLHNTHCLPSNLQRLNSINLNQYITNSTIRMQQQLNQRNPIFSSDNQHVLQGWNNINPQSKQQSVSVQKVQSFMKYVFEKSKNQLQMEIDDDTEFIGMIEDYLEETQQIQKQSFTLHQLVNLLNWAVDPEENEYQQNLSEKGGDIHQQKLSQNQKNVPSKILELLPKVPNQKTQEIKILIGYNQQSNQHQIKYKQKHQQSVNGHHNILDWDKVQGLDNNNSLILYKEINSYTNKNTQKYQQNYKDQNDQPSKPTLRKPESINQSLAKINKQTQSKIKYRQKIPLIKIDPSAPEMKYIKKQKIQFKNKKSKQQFNPQKMGLKLLFKFYCGLNSEFHHKRHKDPAKATFDGLENKVCLLYMHNFMLLCKDFSIIQAKRLVRSNIKNISTVAEKDEQNDQSTEQKAVWDRDKLSNYFKKQADYSLNITYDQFVEVMLHILRDKIQVQQDEHQNFGQSNEPQPKNDEGDTRRVNIDPFTMELCKFFKVETAQNSDQTLNRLKVLYRILQPQQKLPRQKNTVGQLNGHFQEHIKERLKSHQMEKEKARIQVKEKYLSKYSAPPVDSYSSFKAATTQVNSLNSIYGSAPKLLSPKLKRNGGDDEIYIKNTVDYDLTMIRKKNSQDFHSSLGNIIKEARHQVMSANKENLYLNKHNLKQNSNAQSLAKSKFTPLNSKDNLQKLPIIGFIKLQEIRQQKEQDPTLSSILLKKQQQIQSVKTNRFHRMKLKSKDTSSPLLQRIGCHQDDDLLNKYFDQEKHALKVQIANFSR